MKDKALMLSSVASMIDQFNMRNIKILKNLGYKVDVACNFEEGNTTSEKRIRKFKKELTAFGVNFYQIPIPRKISAIFNIIKSYKMVKNLVDNENYKIVHCHSPIGAVITRLACRKARKNGTRVIYTAHGFHFFNGASKLNWLVFYNLEKFCAKFTDVLITINEEDFERAKQFKAKKVEYVPGIGIDTQSLKKISNLKNEVRQELGIDYDKFVIISIGQLSVRKNHEVIIRAIAELKNKNIYFVLCGLGELEDYLKKLADDLGVIDNIIFTGYRKDAVRLLAGADLFVFPSLQEGLPVSLMEAMGVGLGCVASKIRGNTDLLEKECCDFLFEPNDINGFATAINLLYNDRNLLDEIGHKNQIIVKGFDKDVVDEKMKEIYQNI